MRQKPNLSKIYVIFLLLATATATAQLSVFGRNPIINKENFDKKIVHWGYYLGVNNFDFKFDYRDIAKEIEVERTIGFTVGLIGNLRLNDYFNIRFEPGLHIAQRNLTYPEITNVTDRLREVKSTYIDFPLLLKFSAKRTGNIKPYLIAGGSQLLNLSSNSDALDDNYNNRFRMVKWSSALQIGFGIDIYFEYFKFSPSIRGVFGLGNEIIHDNTPDSPWTGNIVQMQTRGVFISFAFH